MSITTPVLNHVPANLESCRTQAERDVVAYERYVESKRVELESAERHLRYLQETRDYWRSLPTTGE